MLTDEEKEELYLTWNFFICGENDTACRIITREQMKLDQLEYLSYIFGKKTIIEGTDSKKVEQFFKNSIFNTKSRSAHIASGIGGKTGVSNREKVEVNFNDAPIIKLVNSILSEAVQSRASDVHLEPGDEKMITRYRIDGELKTVLESGSDNFQAVSSRIKYLARLDITQKLLPQDGKAQVEVNGNFLDLRVSTIPARYGESIVIRLLNRSESFIELEELGLEKETASHIKGLLKQKNGLVLLTGPTGSGKTTTLYAMLKTLNTPDVKILTVENPVEYEIPGICQVEINEKQGLTFPTILRHFLRHDPDIIMIGEIRDEETARIAVQASLTGHLVLSTLHTNDAVSAVTRLMDLGIEPYLLAGSLKGVLAQRLVRRLCECKKGKPPCIPHGCEKCSHSGYYGRTAVIEYLAVTSEVQTLIQRPHAEENINKLLKAEKHLFLSNQLKLLVNQGITSTAEAEKLLYSSL